MAGYKGSSMSWNAVGAYEDGAMPRSKWTKAAFAYWLDATLQEEQGIESEGTREIMIGVIMEKYPMWFLKRAFLDYHSWHHTGSTFNETEFYSIDARKVSRYFEDPRPFDKAFEQAKIDRIMKQREKENAKGRKAYIIFEEWEGSRRHGRYVKYGKYCLVIDGWAYLPEWGNVHEWSDAYKRKQIDGAHVLSLKYFDRAPKGTANYFHALEKMVSRKVSKQR